MEDMALSPTLATRRQGRPRKTTLIMEVKYDERHGFQYLVQWKSSTPPKWEYLKDVLSEKKAMAEFNKKNTWAPRPSPAQIQEAREALESEKKAEAETEPYNEFLPLAFPVDSADGNPDGSHDVRQTDMKRQPVMTTNSSNPIDEFMDMDVEALAEDFRPGNDAYVFFDHDSLKGEAQKFKLVPHLTDISCFCHWCLQSNDPDAVEHDFNEWCSCFACLRFRARKSHDEIIKRENASRLRPLATGTYSDNAEYRKPNHPLDFEPNVGEFRSRVPALRKDIPGDGSIFEQIRQILRMPGSP